MGSHAILDSFDGHVLAAAAPELEAKYYIPIFWLALFEPGDLGREPIAKAQYGWQQEPFAIAAPYLRATSEAACACFARRSRALERLCTPAHAPLVATFAKFIATVKP